MSSAIPEPGPYYEGLIEVGAENVDNWEAVIVRANNPAIKHGEYRDRPVPTAALMKWFRESGVDPEEVKLSEWEFNNKGISPKVDPFFEVHLFFLRPNDAMKFKLAWGAL